MSINNHANSLQNIYTSYFDGLIMGDAEELHWAGRQLSYREGYLMEAAGIDAILLAESLIDGEQIECGEQPQLDFTLCNAIRSYEYSGLPFNGDQVQFTAEVCGYDRQWLRSVVLPSNTVLRHVIGVESRPERSIMRRNGLQAMKTLGMLSRLTSVMVKLDTRLT